MRGLDECSYMLCPRESCVCVVYAWETGAAARALGMAMEFVLHGWRSQGGPLEGAVSHLAALEDAGPGGRGLRLGNTGLSVTKSLPTGARLQSQGLCCVIVRGGYVMYMCVHTQRCQVTPDLIPERAIDKMAKYEPVNLNSSTRLTSLPMPCRDYVSLARRGC